MCAYWSVVLKNKQKKKKKNLEDAPKNPRKTLSNDYRKK